MNVLFLCLARNCEDTLPVFFSYLACLDDHGISCSAIIGENGSQDRTRSLVERVANSKVRLVDTKFMEQGPSRLVRMAIGRQALLEAASEEGTSADYICVADLDNVIREPPEPKSLRKAIELLMKSRDLFAVGASSRPVYYDLLSLRAEGHNYSSLNEEIAEAKKRPFGYFRFHRDRIYANQKLMTGPKPIVCDSSFNGFCIYNAADYRLGTYRADNEAHICEHVTLNLSIARATGKRMQIAPELFVRTPADHAPVKFCQFWYDRIKERLIF